MQGKLVSGSLMQDSPIDRSGLN